MKKLAVVLLALVLVLATVLVPVLADVEVDVIGYSADRVKKVDLTNVVNIKDFDASDIQAGYKITDAEGLVKLSEVVNGGNSLAGVIVYLAADIDMSGIDDFEPIGQIYYSNIFSSTGSSRPTDIADDPSTPDVDETSIEGVANASEIANVPFEGIFNGHGHIISNLVVNVDSKDVAFVGLFGYLSGTVKNLVIDSSCSFTMTRWNGWAGCGAISGQGGSVINVYNAADVNSSIHGGGLIGRGSSAIENCTNAGDVYARRNAGGFVGYTGSKHIKNSINFGNVSADEPADSANASGFFAYSGGAMTIENCVNVGNVSSSAYAAGFLIARGVGNVVVKSCTNYGIITTTNSNTDMADGLYVKIATGGTLEDPFSRNKAGETHDYVAPTITPNYEAEDGVGDGETAFTTTVAVTEQIPGVLNNPTGNEVGFSSARVVEKDTTTLVNIKNYDLRPNETEYKITDVDGLLEMNEKLFEFQTFYGITIYLANDIDMSQIVGFAPLSYDKGTYNEVTGEASGSIFQHTDAGLFYFSGTFDGQGEMINNVVMHSEDPGSSKNELGETNPYPTVLVALFGYVNQATIKNLIIGPDCSFSYEGTSVYPLLGAFTAKADGLTIDNCWNMADVGTGRMVGSICGYANGTFKISNYTNTGEIKGAQIAGGFLGWSQAATDIKNSRNAGAVTRIGGGTDTSACAAGMVARCLGGVNIENSINNGAIKASANVGAFCGTIQSGCYVKNSKNYGRLTATEGNVGMAYGCKDGGTMIEEMNRDYFGVEADPTYLLEVIVPNYTPEADGIIPEASTAATTTAKVTTAKVTTAAPDDATDAPDAGDDEGDDDKGCSSTVIGGVAVIALVSGAAVVLLKKKKED